MTSLIREPTDQDEYEQWILQKEVAAFIDTNSEDSDPIIYAGLPHVFIHSILIPRTIPSTDIISQLLTWNFNASLEWSLVGSNGHLSIAKPLATEHPKLVQSGEPIIFQRSLEGIRQKSSYIELSQKIAHIQRIHQIEERKAWCKLNRHGDMDEIVKIHSIKDRGADCGTIVTMRRSELAEYAAAGNYVVLTMFDFTRYRSGRFDGWRDNQESHPLEESKSIFGRYTRCGNTGSHTRGIQLLDLATHQSDVLQKLLGKGNKELHRYVTFIAYDWYHGRVGDFSCDPTQLGTYYTPSDHPLEMSPAFFRPEVLSKYKLDPEKYLIRNRTLSCRGTWYLKSFGVNDANQVHAYLGYLGELPYEEQLHWRSFNEPPKCGLSESVIRTDFDGEFCEEYDPLLALKQRLNDIQERRVGWWQLRDESLPDRTHYPLTDSRAEWASEIMNLDQLLVEGLVEKWLRKKAGEMGRNIDPRFRPLKLLEECLRGLGFEDDHARTIMTPWHTVHTLRSELKGHASNSGAIDHERIARNEHGSLLKHFQILCQQCDESTDIIATAIEAK